MINKNLKGEYAWLNGRFVAHGMSGGKDSLAAALFLRELGIKFTPIFLDTGFEHEITYEYVYNYLAKEFPRLQTLSNLNTFDYDKDYQGGMEQLIKKRKMFPSSSKRFCTTELKKIPLETFLNLQRKKTRKKPVNVTGVRKYESYHRSMLDEIEEHDEAIQWRPILSFTEEEVVAIIKKHNMKPNPLYLRGFSRVGCYPCIYAKKSEIRLISITDPNRIDELEDLEKKVQAMPKNQNRKATFFYRSKKNLTIKEAVEWSKNRVEDDVKEQEERGCQAWGLCEIDSMIPADKWWKDYDVWDDDDY